MNIFVNDESKNVPAGSSLRSLLVELGMVEFNGWPLRLIMRLFQLMQLMI